MASGSPKREVQRSGRTCICGGRMFLLLEDGLAVEGWCSRCRRRPSDWIARRSMGIVKARR